jgi:hypothetical protein
MPIRGLVKGTVVAMVGGSLPSWVRRSRARRKAYDAGESWPQRPPKGKAPFPCLHLETNGENDAYLCIN